MSLSTWDGESSSARKTQTTRQWETNENDNNHQHIQHRKRMSDSNKEVTPWNAADVLSYVRRVSRQTQHWSSLRGVLIQLRHQRHSSSTVDSYRPYWLCYICINCLWNHRHLKQVDSYRRRLRYQVIMNRHIYDAGLILFHRTDSTDSLPFNVFILLNSWICLYSVLD